MHFTIFFEVWLQSLFRLKRQHERNYIQKYLYPNIHLTLKRPENDIFLLLTLCAFPKLQTGFVFLTFFLFMETTETAAVAPLMCMICTE